MLREVRLRIGDAYGGCLGDCRFRRGWGEGKRLFRGGYGRQVYSPKNKLINEEGKAREGYFSRC